ncbi:MAG: hypothetical protein ACON4Y_06720 [Flavobacteriales bacterium]
MKIIVFLSNYQCSACDKDVVRFITSLKKKFPEIECAILASVGSNKNAQSIYKASLEKQYIDIVDLFCFDIQRIQTNTVGPNYSDGLFKKFKIKTPSLLLLKDKKHKVFRYKKLLKGMLLSRKKKNKIIKFFENK